MIEPHRLERCRNQTLCRKSHKQYHSSWADSTPGMSTRSGSQAARNDHAKIARAEEGSAAAAALKAVAAQAKADIAAEYIFAAAAKMLQLQHEQKSRPPPHSRVLLQRPQPMQGCYRDAMRSLPPSLPTLCLKMSHRLEYPLLHRRLKMWPTAMTKNYAA